MAKNIDDVDVEKRTRTMTDKGHDLFQENCDQYRHKIDSIWKEIEDIVIKKSECRDDIAALRLLEKNLNTHKLKFLHNCKEFHEFLKRSNTEQARNLLEEHSTFFDKAQSIIEKTFCDIKSIKLELVDNMSVTSTHTNSSSVNILQKKRVKAETERTKLLFLKKEVDLERKRAEVEGELRLLKQQTDTAIADAEVKALLESTFIERGLSPEPVDRKPMIQNYVDEIDTETKRFENAMYHTPSPRTLIDIQPTPREYFHPVFATDRLNPNAPSFRPITAMKQSSSSTTDDLTHFLLKKDLLLTRFMNFNDRPESFASWKFSFRNVISELNLSAFEEMDLLVKWLGPESSTYASSIRAANVAYPERGLDRIWERLEDRYGRPEMVESALKMKINNFPKLNRDYTRLYQLSDILSEIESCKENPKYATLLSYFDSSSGVRPIVNKLPFGLQEKWTSQASKYKSKYHVSFPPFSYFVKWIKEVCSVKNDPAFAYETTAVEKDRRPRNTSNPVYARKTDIAPMRNEQSAVKRCPIHKAEHSLDECRAFKSKSYEERREILKKNRICFRCCVATDHVSRNCNANVKCEHCPSSRHTSAMHVDRDTTVPKIADGGERSSPTDPVSSNCTILCGTGFSGRSCGKITLVEVYPVQHPEQAVKVYAILDDQSNRSLASTELFDQLGVSGDPLQYTLSSCSGSMTMIGRRATNIVVRSLSDSCSIKLPTLIECDSIPNNLSEIPTPEVARSYPHLACIASEIPSFDPHVKIGILIGRDLPSVHHVLSQIIGPEGAPFAQELRLGWAIVGDVCLDGKHPPDTVYTNKTNVLTDGRRTIFEPCTNTFCLQEHTDYELDTVHQESYDCVFRKSPNDDKVGLSVEDRKFLDLMEKEFHKDEQGHWIAPLPFRTPKLPMPNNRPIAWKRAQLLDVSLKKNPVKREHFRTFMGKVLDSGAAEVAPPISSDKECWYLPLFGVYHPKKPNQIRGVFDSSAIYQGVSLNTMLMSGPDLTNNLLGVLLRFRTDAVAATADIEQMFYQFYVNEEHRDYLRFFWYRNNNPDDTLIEFRMRVHVFGNSPSPAVATYGLHRAVSTRDCSSDVRDFVLRNFYVDDGLIALPSVTQTVDLISKTQDVLKREGHIRLHKIVSNSPDVMKAFNADDLGNDLKTVQIGQDSLPVQSSLGISWDLNSDSFVFDIHLDKKPFTKRGMLSTINGLFDPMGFLAPITLKGKVLLREAAPPGTDWDEPLSSQHLVEWKSWCQSLQSLRDFEIPRMFGPFSLSTCEKVEVSIFSDASEIAIAAVAYAKVTENPESSHVGFILGKSKLAPQKGHTIPRLELCSAVTAVELGEIVSDHLDIPLCDIEYYTDSKVVLGYIRNETRRFYTYVSNRVDRIRRLSSPSKWNFVPTDLNPADLGTRCNTSAEDIKESFWLQGPEWLRRRDTVDPVLEDFSLISPNDDKEIRPNVIVRNTFVVNSELLGSQRFQRFSRWRSLVKAISLLIHIARSFKERTTGHCSGWHQCDVHSTQLYQDSEIQIIKTVQKECFPTEVQRLSEEKPVHKCSNILALCPFLDSNGILRVGGRLNKLKGSLPTGQLNPIIMPKDNHVTMLLVRDFHESVRHQGRHLTEGAVRAGGFWIIGAKNLISSLIQKCVTCRKLRRDFEHQLMADLPTDRLTPGPPFTSVGVDTFGPWEVVTRKTRGGSAESKRWAILFTCLVTRAVHIEIVQEMSSSSFINALRRFVSLRGPVKLFRSDKGTNFTGATDNLRINTVNVEDGPVGKFLYDSGITWIFNAPHSSHMGGVWERMIGVARKILDSILLDSKSKALTHETLTTFMAEVCAIMNSRPIAPISSDPESPLILNPSMLLTGKTDYLPVIVNSFDPKDVYRAQWKHVQMLADVFWEKWREDYLQCLQSRRKWRCEKSNLKVGSVVLLKDKDVHRNNWPLGIIEEAYESDDKLVRKVKIRIKKDGRTSTFVRPINELVLLLE